MKLNGTEKLMKPVKLSLKKVAKMEDIIAPTPCNCLQEYLKDLEYYSDLLKGHAERITDILANSDKNDEKGEGSLLAMYPKLKQLFQYMEA